MPFDTVIHRFHNLSTRHRSGWCGL